MAVDRHEVLRTIWRRVAERERIPDGQEALLCRANSLRAHADRWRAAHQAELANEAEQLASDYEARAMGRPSPSVLSTSANDIP